MPKRAVRTVRLHSTGTGQRLPLRGIRHHVPTVTTRGRDVPSFRRRAGDRSCVPLAATTISKLTADGRKRVGFVAARNHGLRDGAKCHLRQAFRSPSRGIARWIARKPLEEAGRRTSVRTPTRGGRALGPQSSHWWTSSPRNVEAVHLRSRTASHPAPTPVSSRSHEQRSAPRHRAASRKARGR